MYFVGIDISKYKHDCFIINHNGEIIRNSFSFENTKKGFNEFLTAIKSLDCSQIIKIGLEATGHYGINLKLFLNDNNLSFMEINPLTLNRYIKGITLRSCKTDKIDAEHIAFFLSDPRVSYKPYRFSSYHIQELKSLTRERESLIKERSKQLVKITNILDKIFPEFKKFFDNKLSNTAIYILDKYKSPSRIASWSNLDLEKIHNHSRKIPISKFVTLRSLAKNTVGKENKYLLSLLKSILNIYHSIDNEVSNITTQIEEIMNQYDSPITSIPGISSLTAAQLIAEFEDISRFDNPNQMLAYSGLEPSRSESGTMGKNGKMVKHGSGHLRYALFNIVPTLCIHNPTFTSYYHKKRYEDNKPYRVAQSHVIKKLIRVIFKLEKDNIKFDINLLK